AHLGRRPTAHQRSALEVRDPECVVPTCHVRVGLEIDHVEPWSATRITKLDALARVCRFHHAQKTHEGYRLEGGPGHWRWLKPDGTDVDPRPPPPTRPADDGTRHDRGATGADLRRHDRTRRAVPGDPTRSRWVAVDNGDEDRHPPAAVRPRRQPRRNP